MNDSCLDNLLNLFLKCGNVSIDSRNITSFVAKNEQVLFFAIRGDNFDGNKFAAKALEDGASYAIVDNADVINNKDNRYILVDDTLKALQALSCDYRRTLQTKILAITGSNGKTTTKELINKVLSCQYKTSATVGNLNNHIGVPLTLLSISKDTEIAIIEMGANHQGEIKQLCEIALPDYGIITNMGKAHLEGFKGEEGIIKGKSEMLDFLFCNGGTIFYNTNCNKLSGAVALRSKIKSIGYNINDITYNTNKNGTISITYKNSNPTISSQLVGEYNVYNILAAITVGQYFDIPFFDIASAIESFIPNNNRSQLVNTASNSVIVDVYNANPSSMQSAIDNFIDMNAINKVIILGDMKELGDYSFDEHNKIVQRLTNIRHITKIFIGEQFLRCKPVFDYKNTFFFDDTDSYCNHLKTQTISGSTVLVKGSRSMKMEKIIELL